MTDWLTGENLLVVASVVQAISALVIVRFTRVTLKYTEKTIEANTQLVEHTRQTTDATKRMVDEVEETRKQSVLPAVDLTLNSPDVDDEDTERCFTVDVVNHGLGPAVFLVVRWTNRQKVSDRWCELLSRPDVLTLGAGQSIPLRFRGPWIEPSERRPDATPFEGGGGMKMLGTLSVRYQDVHRRIGLVEREIWLTNEHGPTLVVFMNDETHKYQIPGLEPLEYED